jgi:hypothetical protein
VDVNVSAAAGYNGLFAIRMDCHLPLWQGVPIDALQRCPVLVQVLNALPGLRGRQSFLLWPLDLQLRLLTRGRLDWRRLARGPLELLDLRLWLLTWGLLWLLDLRLWLLT